MPCSHFPSISAHFFACSSSFSTKSSLISTRVENTLACEDGEDESKPDTPQVAEGAGRGAAWRLWWTTWGPFVCHCPVPFKADVTSLPDFYCVGFEGKDSARCVGFRDNHPIFLKHKRLWKVTVEEDQKRDMIEKEIIPKSYKDRAIGVVTARSVFREFGENNSGRIENN